MAKENTSLLLKMVKFVSKPLTDWSSLEHPEPVAEEHYSKQMLKEMIERRRRNDFVRMREFDMLRKIRLRGSAAGLQEQAAVPSFLQSTMETRPDDRAVTLKKINDIEAQMSQQWWKTRHGESPKAQTGLAGVATQVMQTVPMAPAAPASAPYVPTAFAATGLAPAPTLPTAVALDTVPNKEPTGLKSTLFTPSEMNAFFVDEGAHDPDLEEAAIRFANGDDEGAATSLHDVLSKDKNRPAQSELWLALFDLFRVTRQVDQFDRLALEYAIRYGRSAPIHYNISETVDKAAAAVVFDEQAMHWTCPATLNLQVLGTLNAALGRVKTPWRLNWAGLRSIDPNALAPLTQLFTDWMGKPLELGFAGERQLLDVLGQNTPEGDRSVATAWWMLRLDALRLTRHHEDFDSVALDYCVTYEVSPPSWVEPQGQYRNLEQVATPPARERLGARDTTSPASMDFADSSTHGNSGLPVHTSTGRATLEGEMAGDIHDVLDQIEDRTVGADTVLIACDKLVRVDFSAAGNLLNWVSAQSGNGRHIEFKGLHCLVAVLFNVIGIDQHAKVSLRQQ